MVTPTGVATFAEQRSSALHRRARRGEPGERKFNEAQDAINALLTRDYDRANISVLSNNVAGDLPPGADVAQGDIKREAMGEAAKIGAGTGAVLGTGAGGVFGLLVGLGTIVLPGVGPVLAAGPVLALLAGAGVGAVAGAALGGLVGALMRIGVPEHDAQFFLEAVRRGGQIRAVDRGTVKNLVVGRRLPTSLLELCQLKNQHVARSASSTATSPRTGRTRRPTAGPKSNGRSIELATGTAASTAWLLARASNVSQNIVPAGFRAMPPRSYSARLACLSRQRPRRRRSRPRSP